MKVLVTGASGRVGRAVCELLRHEHEVLGLDIVPSAWANVVAPLADEVQLAAALRGCNGVIHCAGLHAPHVGRCSDAQFESANVHATATLLWRAVAAGVGRFVFTSTTALYGAGAMPAGRAAWITEATPPHPVTIYHRSKLAAERLLQAAAQQHPHLAVTALRMSRSFPEPAPLVAVYRLHRGIDVRDVAAAHALALADGTPGFRSHVVSGATPFTPDDAADLFSDAPAVLARRAPELVAAFAHRGWPLPRSIDRVYDSRRAMARLQWQPRYGFAEVLAELDRGAPQVLSPGGA
jgi:UDP-glucose 4-epimerase